MIVDCHTHFWESAQQLGRLGADEAVASRAGDPPSRVPANAGPARHIAACQNVDTTIVLGFKSHYLGAEISNDAVSTYVRAHPHKLLGFAGLDPTRPREAALELERACVVLGLKGLVLAPASQDFHPSDTRAQRIYELAAARQLPVLFHVGLRVTRECKLLFAQPVLLDQVALDFPRLKIIVGRLGYPWVAETLTLLAKHENVYADISGLLHQPWQAYQALLGAHEAGVMAKLLFGSGFPYSSATQSIEALYGINHLCAGTSLPKIPREALRGIVECDALELLGLPRPATGLSAAGASSLLDDETEMP